MIEITKDFMEKKFKVVQGTDILVKCEWTKETRSKSGIVVDMKPSMVEDRPTQGIVIQTGFKVSNVKVGDTVFWGKTSGIDLYREDETAYILLNEEKVLGIGK